MTEKEWMAVTLAFTDLFDKLKKAAPEQISIDKTLLAGKILQQEHDRIRARNLMFDYINYVNWSDKKIPRDDWQKRNEELERKKEAERSQELGDLADTLKASIEKAEKDRQGE